MKRIIYILLVALVFLSCKHADKKENNETVYHEETLNNHWVNDIKLNEGGKWQVNTATHHGVFEMQKLLKTEKTVSLEDYHHLAKQLNHIKNTIIKKCDMKGDAHNNLHIWLLPLIEKLDLLLNTDSVDEASIIKRSIEANVAVYHTYFIQ